MPLGVDEGTPFDAMTLTLQPGDCIVQFTDGVPEARSKDEKERAIKLAEETRGVKDVQANLSIRTS